MALLRPFRALHPNPNRAPLVAAVPYDVVNRSEAAVLAGGNPWSFLHVSRPEIDLPVSVDPHAPEVYAAGRATFDRLVRDCPLVTEPEGCLYLYCLEMNGRRQVGLAATFSIDAYESGDIRRHERTRQDKEDDRTKHVLTLGAQTGPVFLAYRDTTALAGLRAAATTSEPEIDFTAPDQVRHRLWKIDAHATQPWISAFAAVSRLYIADGHHRAASASRARTELRSKNPKHTGTEDYNYVLAVAFPANELQILPYHRLILASEAMRAFAAGDLLKRLEADFRLTPSLPPQPERGEFSLYTESRWYRLTPRRGLASSESPIAQLDVSVLQDRVLGPIFGITDPRTDKRIDFVGGIRGTAELERRVNAGEARFAFAMHPTTLDELFAVSDADEIMPPKSTWFEPKLRDGLVSHWIRPTPG